MHYRSEIRQAAISALSAVTYFAAATRLLSSAKVGVETLPCWSVSTPSEDSMVQSTVLSEVRTNLVVAISLAGGADDIEDMLDEKSAAIEMLILGAFAEGNGPQNVQLKRTEIKTGPEDKTITGSVMMLFEVTGYIKDT